MRLPISPQDVLVVNCTSDFLSSNHVLATCRTALKRQGVAGLHMAPCMRAFLERLPVMLQEQYAYEKVPPAPPCVLTAYHSCTISFRVFKSYIQTFQRGVCLALRGWGTLGSG